MILLAPDLFAVGQQRLHASQVHEHVAAIHLLDRADHDLVRPILEILEDRHNVSSTIVTSQLPISKWHDVIGDPTIADAILDRVVHNAHKIELKGESVRKTKAKLD